jgi:hypothetical protein
MIDKYITFSFDSGAEFSMGLRWDLLDFNLISSQGNN